MEYDGELIYSYTTYWLFFHNQHYLLSILRSLSLPIRDRYEKFFLIQHPHVEQSILYELLQGMLLSRCRFIRQRLHPAGCRPAAAVG